MSQWISFDPPASFVPLAFTPVAGSASVQRFSDDCAICSRRGAGDAGGSEMVQPDAAAARAKPTSQRDVCPQSEDQVMAAHLAHDRTLHDAAVVDAGDAIFEHR